MFSKYGGRRALALFIALFATVAHAQSTATHDSHEVDLALTFSPARQGATNGSSFWQMGGAAELSATAYRGWGAAMLLSGGTAKNANGTGVDVNTVSIVFGPRYTFNTGKFAIFGEGLLGESNAFGGVYPSAQGALASYDAMAVQVGGGVDIRVTRRFSVRALQAYWLRTQFPNATTNVQNSLQLGAGIVLRLQR